MRRRKNLGTCEASVSAGVGGLTGVDLVGRSDIYFFSAPGVCQSAWRFELSQRLRLRSFNLISAAYRDSLVCDFSENLDLFQYEYISFCNNILDPTRDISQGYRIISISRKRAQCTGQLLEGRRVVAILQVSRTSSVSSPRTRVSVHLGRDLLWNKEKKSKSRRFQKLFRLYLNSPLVHNRKRKIAKYTSHSCASNFPLISISQFTLY